MVTADGSFHVASEKDDADLFWAIRGGGGNFGVVTSFEFRLSPVKDIYGGPMFFELDKAGDLFRFYREFIADAPEQFGGFPAYQIAPPLPFIPEDRHGEPLALMVACWAGDLDQGEKMLKPFHDLAPVVAEMVGPMPYPALNSAFDALYPSGLRHYWKANFVKELTDDAIAAHVEHGSKVPELTSTMHIYPINGACHRVAPDATAFAYRDANFATVIAGMWPDAKDDEREHRLGPRLLRGHGAALGGGRLHQLHGRGRPGPDPRQLQGQLRPAGRDQADATTPATCSGTTRTSRRRRSLNDGLPCRGWTSVRPRRVAGSGEVGNTSGDRARSRSSCRCLLRARSPVRWWHRMAVVAAPRGRRGLSRAGSAPVRLRRV